MNDDDGPVINRFRLLKLMRSEGEKRLGNGDLYSCPIYNVNDLPAILGHR